MGLASLNFISRLPILLQFLTASTRFFSPYDATAPESMLALDTNVIEVAGTMGANMGRMMMGSTVGIEALGSPCEFQYQFNVERG